MSDYRVIFPLGAWCQVADQLKLNGIDYVKTPVEWTVTPFGSLLAILKDEGRSFGLDVERTQGDHTAQCRIYGVLHHHDYPRDEANENKLLPITDEAKETVAGKFRHKTERFIREARAPGRKLFIRLGGEAEPAIAWPYLPDEKPLAHSRLNLLASSIEQFCQSPDFDLAFVYYPSFTNVEADEPLDARVKVFSLPHPSAPDSRGDVPSWAPVFASLGLLPV